MPDALFPKFRVTRSDGGTPVSDAFVLVPAGDRHARAALHAYADSCRDAQPGLATDLDQWLESIAPTEPPAVSEAIVYANLQRMGLTVRDPSPAHTMQPPSDTDLRWTCSGCDWAASDAFTSPEERGARFERHHSLADPEQSPRCGARCWFAYYGWVGSSAPTCRRCGRPNPRYRPTDDPFPRPQGQAS